MTARATSIDADERHMATTDEHGPKTTDGRYRSSDGTTRDDRETTSIGEARNDCRPAAGRDTTE